eukprot:1606549-Pyramimonas_sp.AAC.1
MFPDLRASERRASVPARSWALSFTRSSRSWRRPPPGRARSTNVVEGPEDDDEQEGEDDDDNTEAD